MRPSRGWVPVVVCVILSIPVLLAAITAVTFYTANADDHSLASSGQRRGYVLHVPANLQRGRPAPLVISLHGAALWGAAERELSRWNAVADREGFVVAYPSALRGSGPSVWHVERGPRLMDDVRFIADLIDTLRATYDIDSTRIFVDGASNGGGMAFVLSCTLSDRIAAIGLVASAQTLPFDWCTDRRPVPVIAFHGTADPIVPYAGGRSLLAPRPFPAVPGWIARWAKRNRCDDSAVDSATAPHVTRREYVHCADDADVVFYMIRGGGHTWPGGGPLPSAWVGRASSEIDATRLMWAFYSAHPLVRR